MMRVVAECRVLRRVDPATWDCSAENDIDAMVADTDEFLGQVASIIFLDPSHIVVTIYTSPGYGDDVRGLWSKIVEGCDLVDLFDLSTGDTIARVEVLDYSIQWS